MIGTAAGRGRLPCIALRSARRSIYTLPELPYAYDALEPVVSREIMKLHHQKHHQAYVANLNASLEQLAMADSSEDVPKITQLTRAINFNGGGHVNHSIFWRNLCPPDKALGSPQGELLESIEGEFCSFANFQKAFAALTTAIQGSGWGWLGFNPITKRLQIATTGNQDTLLSVHGLVPLLGLDVWEHAYYLQYKNMRPDYVNAMWQIINWEDVAARLSTARSGN